MTSTKEDCERLFNESDVNKDGYLTYDELCNMLRKHGFTGSDSVIKGFFDAADTSGDEKISLDEFLALMGKVPENITKEALMRRVFRSFDKNKNGVIDQSELKEVYAELGRHLPDEDVQRAMKMVDKDDSGTIDYDEFIAFFFSGKGECQFRGKEKC